MNDLISRKAAIKETWREPRYTDPLNVLTEMRDRLRNLPSAEPEPKWIPCSEKLPEDGTEVFVYLFDGPKSPYIAWIEDCRWYTEDFEVDREHEPIAWMPLPSPYRAGEQE